MASDTLLAGVGCDVFSKICYILPAKCCFFMIFAGIAYSFGVFAESTEINFIYVRGAAALEKLSQFVSDKSRCADGVFGADVQWFANNLFGWQ